MNRARRRAGARCTRFASSHGLEPGNRSCARDLAVLTRLAMKRARIRRIVRRRQAAFRFPIKGGRLYLSGHNPLIRAGYPGAIGLKTGYTDEAGPLLRGSGPARRPDARRGAAALTRSVEAGGEAAGRGLRGSGLSGADEVEPAGLEPATPCLQSRCSSN